MRFITEHIAVIDSTNEVAFFRKHPSEHECNSEIKWIEVEDLEAWISDLWDKIRDISSSVNAGSFYIENEAFKATGIQ